MVSLFSACKSVVRNNSGGTFNIGGYDIDIEYYTLDDINNGTNLGDNDESKIVMIAGDTITFGPNDYITPASPKKSLVIFCNNLINNGTISMYQKAPNVLPHDYFIISAKELNSNSDIIIPAYANNQVSGNVTTSSNRSGSNGNNGTDRQCGSGGQGSYEVNGIKYTGLAFPASGSGYAFGGGAGSAGGMVNVYQISPDVDPVYPMRGGVPIQTESYNNYAYREGGVGNPITDNACPWGTGKKNNFGCGGRIIIFCNTFTNNGTITVNGTDTKMIHDLNSYYQSNRDLNSCGFGGASGAGAVDIFYTNKIAQGTITATGGQLGASYSTHPGKGGNGSITLTQWSLDKVVKEERKMFTINNWAYLFNEYTTRLREDVI